jgi:hypothetical protein
MMISRIGHVWRNRPGASTEPQACYVQYFMDNLRIIAKLLLSVHGLLFFKTEFIDLMQRLCS